MSDESDYDFGPLPGLPAALPEGERLLWRGRPAPVRTAIRAMHLRFVGGYFVVLAGWQLAAAVHDGADTATIVGTLGWTATLAAFACAILGLMGWVIALNTWYSVTSHRLIVRHGVAMPMAVNIPFAKVDAIDVRHWHDGTSDVALKLARDSRIPRLLLWPHVRQARYRATEPMLRSVPDGVRVGRLIADAIGALEGQRTAPAPLVTSVAERPEYGMGGPTVAAS
jgi:hypothetical protein